MLNNAAHLKTIQAALPEIEYDMLISLIKLPDERIETVLYLLSRDALVTLHDTGQRAATALQALVAANPDHSSPVQRELATLERITDIATGTKDWVAVLWDGATYDHYKYQELGNLTLGMLLTIKYFDLGHQHG